MVRADLSDDAALAARVLLPAYGWLGREALARIGRRVLTRYRAFMADGKEAEALQCATYSDLADGLVDGMAALREASADGRMAASA
jgi:hypothetical protein